VIQNVFRGFSLDTGDLFVNSGQWKVFDLFLKISAHIHNGAINVDFSSNDFQVTSPWALLRITNLEPQLPVPEPEQLPERKNNEH
jgi:hypothetical protein